MSVKRARPATIEIMLMTIKSSMKVKPLDSVRDVPPRLHMEVLGDAIDRRDDRNSDEAHKQTHEYHECRLNERREILREFLYLVLVHFRKVAKCLRERTAFLSDSNHVREDIGEDIWTLLQIGRDLLATSHNLT